MRKIKIDDFIVDNNGTSGFVNSIDYDPDTHNDFVEIYLFPEEMRARHGNDSYATIYIKDIVDVYRTGFDPEEWKHQPTSYVQLKVEKVPDFKFNAE